MISKSEATKMPRIGKRIVINQATTLLTLWPDLSYQARQDIVKEIVERIDVSAESLFQFQIKAPSSLTRLRLLNVLRVRLRRLSPRRLDGISDLKPELHFDIQHMPGFDSNIK